MNNYYKKKRTRKKCRLITILFTFLFCSITCASSYNIAPKSHVSTSSVLNESYDAGNVTDGNGVNLGLSEIEVFPAPKDYPDYVSWVDPYIETTRGRYFFFITGNQPYGMIGAAPLTRNKNQFGGGYNYNSTEVLGFPQIHCWMLSGLTLMPTTGNVDPTQGEQHWKSPFTHDGEIAQPGYHRLYLEKYNTWVEQTATDRVSFYRLTFTKDTLAHILFNLGGYVSTSTMVNAQVHKTANDEITGSFDTQGRLWGGPDVVKIFFVIRFDKPFDSLDGWADKEYFSNIEELQGTKESTPRNSGMSYSDAPTSGVSAIYKVQPGEQIQVKMAISYVSIANAKENLEKDCNHWNFDKVRKNSQDEWNQWLGKIDAKGGTDAQKIKLYTDLWHVLLGRHKLDDFNGEYPDYTTGGTRQGSHTIHAVLKVQELNKDKSGRPIHHIYNSDAFWLTQYWVRRVKEQAYGGITPDKGYGGQDEDQGQMGGISTLMAIGLFSLDGGSKRDPAYDITSPVFDEVTIKLDSAYYPDKEFKIKTYNNSKENCYIQRARLNGKEYNSYQIPHAVFAQGGLLELWLGNTPNEKWGVAN